MASDPNRPTLHPVFVRRALDAEAEAWARETSIVDDWLGRMSTDPRTVAKLRQIAVLAFTEGLYRGVCNMLDKKPLVVTVEEALALNVVARDGVGTGADGTASGEGGEAGGG